MSNETLRPATELRSAGNPGNLIPAIGYARVSTWREEMISVEIQVKIVEEAAARRGRYISEWIVDPDATGRNFKRKVMRAIEIVEDGARAEREVWSWKFSRFGRNRHGVAVNLARIEAVGGDLVSATEEVDPKTAVGRFTRGMLLELAAFESDRAGEQWKEAHDLRRSKGLPATGGKRFGYVWHPRRIPDGQGGIRVQEEWYEADPDLAELSLEGIQAYNAGRVGYGKIAMRWNELGVLNTRGRPWQDQTVRWYYDSGFGAGLLVTHRSDVQCSDPGRCQKPPHYSHLPGEHEAIWSGAEWDDYRARRETRRSVSSPRALNPAYPLSGLIRCGECGSFPINDKVRENPCYAYQCGARARHTIEHETVWIRRAVVEARVYEWLIDVRDEIDAIAAGTKVLPAPRRAPDTGAARSVLEAQLAKLAAAIDRATTGHVLGDIPRDSYLRTRDTLMADRAEVQRKLDALPKEEAETGPAPFRDAVQGLLDEWDTIGVMSKRTILASLIRRVEICVQKTVRVVPVWAPAEEEPGAEPTSG